MTIVASSDRCELCHDGQEREDQVVKDELVSLQAVLQSLADCPGLPPEVKSQRQPHDVREQVLAQCAEHAPLRVGVQQRA
jgi:hypothetical protein